ncbi:Hypothetical predicted protein [Mytilus galloprovincialis]|uniref:Sphingomyelin synthase-like domain-containing protein n=1 Tax=Mytilus galloprovincialis TaxID=29158 RepID=A0A8B6CE13_MYTGA|nr:Hypothetical predicted protein [Mytilus galloprovincialis]
MRRMFSMIGTIFILRCICMLITSLSVPGAHLKCEGKLYGDIWTKLRRTFEIWTGLGMTLSGVRTCGDYMFSGHTVFVTMLNFLITEYTPRKMYYLHTSAWVANMFALFFILAAHEHYSIDVFVAFYITSRMFLYYHTLANNRSLMLRDKKRTRIWFPLFTFFESRCDGIVPNEFEWPLPNMFVLNRLHSTYESSNKSFLTDLLIYDNFRIRLIHHLKIQYSKLGTLCRPKRKINQEVWKTGVSIVYTFFVHFVTSFAIIVAQERMPDKKQYRPLPDVMLDSITYVPWAYKVPAVHKSSLGKISTKAGFLSKIFKNFMFILLRRMFVIAASIFLFRSICVIVTSLPMPQENFNCEKLVFKNGWERFSRALEIYSGMGMKVSGLKTCGDYMFSGHTVTITTLILLINEYTPKRWIFLHILVWIVGLSGMIFILAGHGHYTLDVIVAFYITSRSE